MTPPAFSLRQVGYASDQTRILRDISFDVTPGQWVGILGPNGAGKSTLLRIMAGVLSPSAGRIVLEGRALEQWSATERARRLAFMAQRTDLTFPFCVREVVAMGRTPYLRRWQSEGADDERIVHKAMVLTETVHLADRTVTTLSGGELQRVALARALAQQPNFFLLDEPTASLDLRHQFDILEVLTGLVHQGVTILTALHDLNLAASVCSTVILLRTGHIYTLGPPDEVLTPETIRAVYEVDVVLDRNPSAGTLQIVPLRATRPPIAPEV